MAGARAIHLRTAVRVGCVLPLGTWAWWMATGGLGANPVEASIRMSGQWAFWLLLACLAVTPTRRLLRMTDLAPLRRTLGLFSFFYGVLHVVCYGVIDQALDFGAILTDMLKRMHIGAGVVAFVVLALLAATSPRRMVVWLGAMRWRRLHQLVHVVAIVTLLHICLLTKGRSAEPWIYGVLLALLLLPRLLSAGAPRMAAAIWHQPTPPHSRAASLIIESRQR